METTSENPKPGDYLLNKYFLHADRDTKERALEAFTRYAMILYRLGTRIYEKQQAQARGEVPRPPEVPITKPRKSKKPAEPRYIHLQFGDEIVSILTNS